MPLAHWRPRLTRALALLAAAAIAIGSAQAQPVPDDSRRRQNLKSDWEIEQERRDWKEASLQLPTYPKGEGLIEFFVSGASSFTFFIDPASVALGEDGVVRYTLIARSQSGVANTSFEGIHCANNTYKVFAYGNDGQWSPGRSDWRAIEAKSVQRWHNELRDRYFCPNQLPIWTAAEGLDALRRGGHPSLADRGQRR